MWCRSCGARHMRQLWTHGLPPGMIQEEGVQLSTRRTTSSNGLLSILTQHEKGKKSGGQETKEREEGKTVRGIGIFGGLAKRNKTIEKTESPGQKSSFQSPPPTDPVTVRVESVPPPEPVSLVAPHPKAVPESHGMNGSSSVRYDDRWARLLKPPPTNGVKGHHSQPNATSKSATMEVQHSRREHRPHQRTITISDDITTKMFAHKLNMPIPKVEQVLLSLGEAPESTEDTLSMDAAELVAGEFGFHVTKIRSSGKTGVVDASLNHEPLGDREGKTVSRPPVVTVMGHVDHGKTTLLDALRHTSVAAREAGGITQHIGAFEVSLKGSEETLTFLDTPGHSAFSAMRARGARVTDLVVLVVAADDGVMPQTKECINLIRQAGCQYVVAITKCDLQQVDVEKVKMQLGAESVELEEFGGNVQLVAVAAVTRKGLNELQEALLLQAMNVDLAARLDVPATAVVVEANKNKGLGPVATVIVTGGTLTAADCVVVGHHWGKIRQMKAPSGSLVTKVTPGRPVEICGLRSVPQPGDELMVVCNEDRAKRVSVSRLHRQELSMHQDRSVATSHPGSQLVPFVLKTDTQGTGEAVLKAIEGLSSDVIAPEIVSHSVGDVTEADIMFAEAVDAQILAFNVKPLDHDVQSLSQRKNIVIHRQSVIYRLLDIVGQTLLERAPLCEEEDIIGEALVQKIFNIKCKRSRSTLCVAGCVVKSGSVQKSEALFRLLRSDQVLFQGACASLKRHKLDVDRVGKGAECGIMLDSFSGAEEGDLIQSFFKRTRKPKTETVMGGGLRVVEFSNATSSFSPAAVAVESS